MADWARWFEARAQLLPGSAGARRIWLVLQLGELVAGAAVEAALRVS